MKFQMLNDLTGSTEIENDSIEPGLLQAFRLYIGIRIAVLCISSVFSFLLESGGFLPYKSLASLLWLAALYGYLSWRSARNLLGPAYLPLAIAVLAVAPFAEPLFLQRPVILLKELSLLNALSQSWQLIAQMLIPIVFLAWQYGFKSVLIFCGLLIVLAQVPFVTSSFMELKIWPTYMELILSTIGSFILIGLVISRMVFVQKERQRYLSDANSKLIDQAITVEQLAISHERNRLARDLHDTLAHTLSAVSVQLEAVNSLWEQSPDDAYELLQKSLSNSREGLAETRRALRALRSSPLDDLGLTLALRTYAETTTSRNGLELEVNLPETLALDHDLEESIYRIAQEALTNVARHASASKVSIRLTSDPESITLVVSDDGLGFSVDNADRSGHYGLIGIEERASSIGAKVEIISLPEAGSTLRLIIPRNGGS